MGEIKGEINFSERGDRRRLKAAIALVSIYTGTFALHLAPWGQKFIFALAAILGLHALRLVLPGRNVHIAVSPDLETEELPFISLLVAAKNEEAVIARLVTELCQLDYQSDRLELWVIDDNSSDRTHEVLERLQQKYPQLKTLRRGEGAQGGKSGALNEVLPLTKGEIIGVFDADAQVPANCLYALLPLFEKTNMCAVQLRKSIANFSTNFWTRGQSAEMALDIWLQDRRIRVGGTGELRGNGQFVRRSALLSCGGWNEQTITDDLDLTFKLHLADWDIACLAYPGVQEEGVVTWKQLWHQRNRWAEGGYQRFLDYWPLISSNKMGMVKTFDMFAFLLMQYLLPTAAVPDLIGAIALHKPPILSPLVSLALGLSTLGMFFGIRSSYRPPLMAAAIQTLRGTIYMLHWIPVMASVTLRMSIRPKRLKWVKTVHQGLGDTLVLEELEELA
jgi:1,2-diacylglycerol 3-beta-glucosyltransferase